MSPHATPPGAPGPVASDAARRAVAVSGLVFAAAAPLTYMIIRLFERLRGGVSDPSLILQEAHTGFYWRAAIACWWAGLLAVAAFAGAHRTTPGGGVALRGPLVFFAALPPLLGYLAWRLP